MKTNMEYKRLFKEKHPDAGAVGVTIINGMVRARDSNHTEYFPVNEGA